MANWCYYEMKVTGARKDVADFIDILKGDKYSRIRLYCNDVSDVDFDDVMNDAYVYPIDSLASSSTSEGRLRNIAKMHTKEEIISIIFNAECKWSVTCCMLSEFGTYYDQNRPYTTKSGKVSFARNKAKLNKRDLVYISRTRNLCIDIISEEFGEGFSERIIIKKGNMVTNECNPYGYIACDNIISDDMLDKDELEKINAMTDIDKCHALYSAKLKKYQTLPNQDIFDMICEMDPSYKELSIDDVLFESEDVTIGGIANLDALSDFNDQY